MCIIVNSLTVVEMIVASITLQFLCFSKLRLHFPLALFALCPPQYSPYEVYLLYHWQKVWAPDFRAPSICFVL